MKTKLIHTITFAAVIIGSLALSSCQAPSSTPTAAVTCDKCQTVHYMAPSSGYSPGTKGIVTLRHSTSMKCPDCENKVVAMLKGGNVTKHACASCGGTLRHCTNH